MISINLLPLNLKQQRVEAKKNASLISICIMMVIIVAVLGIVASAAKKTIEAYVESNQSDIEKSNNQQGENKNLEDLALLINDRATAAKEVNSKRAIWSAVLTDLASCAPADLQFENLAANAEKSPNFTLQANTSSERQIIVFKNKLEQSSFFKNVSFQKSSLNAGSTEASTKVSFSLNFDLEKFADKAVASPRPSTNPSPSASSGATR